MVLVINAIDPVSIVAFAIILVGIIFAFIKKWTLTYVLISINIIIFIMTFITQTNFQYITTSPVLQDLAFRSVYLSVEESPQIYTIFTSMFVHGGFLHLLGNMLVFFFVGSAFEERIGSKNLLIIYVLTGVFGSLTHAFFNMGSPIPLVGASGAIFGIMGAFAFSYPRDEVVMPIPLGIIMILRRIKVVYAVLIFAVFETVIVFLDVQDSTAHFAHIGGLISGFVLAAILLRGRKTHTKAGRTIYYDSYNAQRPSKINFSNLEEFATTPELKEMLTKIKNENVPQVRDIWLEHFFEKAVCPKCGKPLNHFDRRVWCEDCKSKYNY